MFSEESRHGLIISEEKMPMNLAMAIRRDLDGSTGSRIDKILGTLDQSGIKDKLMREEMTRLTSAAPMEQILSQRTKRAPPKMTFEQFGTILRVFLLSVLLALIVFIAEVRLNSRN